MTVSKDGQSTEAAHRLLLAQLEQLERECAAANLHDPRCLEECRRKIAALRAQIACHLRDCWRVIPPSR